MGEINNAFTHYFRDRGRFADLFNGICFQGRSVISPQQLTDASEVYHEVEAEKTDRLIPIYTLCVYHGLDKWDGPRNLKDMMDFGKDEYGMSSLFHNYPMHLYCLNEMDDFNVFHSEIRQLFQAMQFRKDKKKLQELMNTDTSYQHLDADTLEVISVMLNIPNIWENREKYMSVEEGQEDYNMCQALREWMEDERREGMITTLVSLVRENVLSLNDASKRAGITEEEFQQKMKKADES